MRIKNGISDQGLRRVAKGVKVSYATNKVEEALEAGLPGTLGVEGAIARLVQFCREEAREAELTPEESVEYGEALLNELQYVFVDWEKELGVM